MTPRCPELTARQEEVLRLCGDGLGLRDIAHRLGITESTAKAHRDAGRRRLDARTTAHAVRIVTERYAQEAHR